MAVYYNEFDSFAAAWLRELIADGQIAAGDVDERDIREVQADDIRGYTQAHFFAGIGGWSYALRLAGWSDDRLVWTGSCPCQPFSAAGKREGHEDARHLWPEWFRLIRECRPSVVFGEQVAAAIGWGWLDLVSADLEGCGYALGSAVLPAASVGAPHKRDRLWFVADANSGCEPQNEVRTGLSRPRVSSPTRGVADTEDTNRRTRERGTQAGIGTDGERGRRPASGGPWSDLLWLPCRDGKARPVADPNGWYARTEGIQRSGEHGQQPQDGSDGGGTRPTQSGIQPLAHGVPNRVGTLRGAGNAIVPQVAAAFIEAYQEAVAR